MAAGRLVFPFIMVCFVLFFVGFVFTTPVNEAAVSPESRFLRARDGDSVLIEFTAYTGAPGSGFAFFTTQEERAGSLPVGDIEPSVQDEPIAVHLSPDQPAGGLRANLIGKRAGDKFTTPAVSAADAFGDWESERELPRTLVELTFQVRFDSATPLGPGQSFNASQYLAFWKTRDYDLQVGTAWPCEGPELWECRVDDVSVPNNAFVYTRLAKPGGTYPVGPIWGSLPVGGDMSWDVSVQPSTDPARFVLRLDPPVGTRFQFLQNAGGPFVAGTYKVETLSESSIQTSYTAAVPAQAGLIGESVFYDIEIVNITRRA